MHVDSVCAFIHLFSMHLPAPLIAHSDADMPHPCPLTHKCTATYSAHTVMHARTHTNTHTHMRARTHTHTHTHVHTHLQDLGLLGSEVINKQTHTHTHTHTSVRALRALPGMAEQQRRAERQRMRLQHTKGTVQQDSWGLFGVISKVRCSAC